MHQQLNNISKWQLELLQDTELQKTISNTFEKIGIEEYFLRTEKVSSYPRYIRDDVWGNIYLSPEIISIVETPFFQKLRHITKLGLTSLVYPGATHTLLEHSLGSYHTLQKILNLPNNALSIENEDIIANTSRIKLEDIIYKHASLMAELGQPPFGEFCSSILLNPNLPIYKNITFGNKPLNQLIDEAVKILEIEPGWMPQEIFNLKIITSILLLSKPFSDFYNDLWCFKNFDRDVLQFSPSVMLAGCNLGISLYHTDNFFIDIFHGPFGANTMDELLRDLKRSGIPCPLDHERILSTASIVSRQNESNLFAPGYRTLFIDKLDPFVFREISMSKELIDLKVYTHPWRIAIQNLFQEMLNSSLNCEVDNYIVVDGKIDYLRFWSMFEEELISFYRDYSVRETSLIAKRLIFRQVPRRCFVISKQTLSNRSGLQVGLPDEIKTFFNHLNNYIFNNIQESFLNIEFKNKFIVKLKEEIKLICTLLDKEIQIDKIEIYSVSNGTINETCISPYGFCYDSQNPNDRQVIFKPSIKDNIDSNTIYFYASEELKEFAFIALKSILYKEFKFEYEDLKKLIKDNWKIGKYLMKDMRFLIRPQIDMKSCLKLCGLKNSNIEEIEQKLINKNYFDQTPLVNEINDDYVGRIRGISKRFAAFQGDGNYKVTEESMTYFVQQFPPKLRKNLINLISRIQLLTRPDLTDNLINTIKDTVGNVGGDLYSCPLSKTSGNRLSTNLGKQFPFCKDHVNVYDLLNNMPENKKNKIIFYDDNLISGTQAIDTFKIWLGLSDEQNAENGNKGKLNPKQMNILLSSEIYFSFYVAWETGVKNVVSYLQKKSFLIDEKNIRYKKEIMELSGVSTVDENLRLFLKSVGLNVYSDKRERSNEIKDDLIVNNRALGFDNLEGLFITDQNVPTATYTALWCPGIVYNQNSGLNVPWKPLFMRNDSFINFVW